MNDFVTAGLADGLAERGVPFKGPRDRSGGAARHCYLGTHRATEGSAPSPGGISAASSRVNLPAGTRGTKSSSSQEAEALVPSEPRPPPPRVDGTCGVTWPASQTVTVCLGPLARATPGEAILRFQLSCPWPLFVPSERHISV